MSKELITVVTVCFNAGQTIAKTMQSVLNQTYRPLEYINSSLKFEIMAKQLYVASQRVL